MFLSTSLLLASLATFGSAAAPAPPTLTTHCPNPIAPAVPSNQTQLTLPAGSPSFLALGRGIQNYTCTLSGTTGTYTSIGALARLFDVSCITTAAALEALPAAALAIPFNPLPTAGGRQRMAKRVASTTFSSATLLADLKSCSTNFDTVPGYLGFHDFVDAPTLSPEFNFTQSQNSATDFVIGTKVGSIPSPTTPTTNVAWLQIDNASGSLAQTLFRLYTAGGQPPTSCSVSGEALSVQYAALYSFY